MTDALFSVLVGGVLVDHRSLNRTWNAPRRRTGRPRVRSQLEGRLLPQRWPPVRLQLGWQSGGKLPEKPALS
jgi:hypothetical protein